MASPMENHLSALDEVAHSSCVGGKPIVLNKLQCESLAHICIRSLSQIGDNLLPPPLLEEISGTLQEIVRFFKCCTEGLWLSSLATSLDPHEAQLVHLKNFMVCMAISQALALAQKSSNASPFIDRLLQSTAECERNAFYSEFEAHTRRDWYEMLLLLSEHQRKHQDSKKGCFPCYFSKRRQTSREYRLATFVAKKCNELVRLSATPIDVPETYCIAFKDLGPQHLLSEEGLNSVYEQAWLGQTVAVKEFDTSEGAFVKETSYLAGLSNPYIVKLIGWSKNEVKGTYSLVMERMQEGLHNFLSSNSPSLLVAVDIMLQVSRGMEYLHSMGVIHRDLKPANILVNPCIRNGGYVRVKLSDFGTAKFKPESMLYSTERQGTLYYRAPEVLQYEDSPNGEGFMVFKKYTLKADVFSFAILCYEILAERAPDCYINCHPREYYNRVTSNVRPQLPDSCPPLLADCIERCWHSDPLKRPSFSELSKLLVYMKSALLVFESPSVAGCSTTITNFVCTDCSLENE